MALDIANLSPEDLEQLKNLLGIKDTSTRSPAWKPLRDMRAPQSATGRLNRPHFEWSAEAPPEGTNIPAFPRLMWDAQGIEHKVSAEQMETVPSTWTPYPPIGKPLTDQERVQAEIASLSPEDREFVLTAHKTARMKRIQESLGQFSEADIALLMPAKQAVVEATKETPETKKVKAS